MVVIMVDIHDTRFGPVVQRAIMLVIRDEINLLRVELGLSERTNEQVENAVQAKFTELGGE
jgi:hypothetical protein